MRDAASANLLPSESIWHPFRTVAHIDERHDGGRNAESLIWSADDEKARRA